MFGPATRIGGPLWLASLGCLVAGGALWALSPVGVTLSEAKFKTPDVFWMLFPSAPLLLAVGVLGLLLRHGEGRGWLSATLAGLVLVAVGDVGLFHLGLDDAYIMAAPAYRTFRAGLVLAAAGALLFAFSGTRQGSLPTWCGLPFALSALAGLFAVIRDLGPFGAALWAVFGAGWVWLGLALGAWSAGGGWLPASEADGPARRRAGPSDI